MSDLTYTRRLISVQCWVGHVPKSELFWRGLAPRNFRSATGYANLQALSDHPIARIAPIRGLCFRNVAFRDL